MAEDFPKAIGRYDISRILGRGAMGVVYQARDRTLDRKVALKTFSLAFAVDENDRARFEKRFLAEARAAAGLSHPNIVVVYDVGRDDASGVLYMALEHLRGKTLDALLATGVPLDWRETLRTVGQLAEALHLAHGQGIIHRDVKPANVMILPSGEPKLMDFGIAKVPASELTATGQFFGSPSYMSPEQALGEPTQAKSDQFSLGSVLYELLTGGKAFPGPGIAAILRDVAEKDPPPPHELVHELPAELGVVTARAMAKRPSDRYPDARAMARHIETILASQSGPIVTDSNIHVDQPAASDEPAKGTAAKLAGLATALAGGSTLRLPAGVRISVTFLSGVREGDVLTLKRPRLLIGRKGGGARADLEVDDGEVSRSHAVLECHGERIVLLDLGSTNGTFVGDERISEMELEDRAEFRVGSVRLMLVMTEEEPGA